MPQFQAVYLELCAALRDLGNPTEAFCPPEALIPRANSIIDVARLHGLGTPAGDDTLSVTTDAGRTTRLPCRRHGPHGRDYHLHARKT